MNETLSLIADLVGILGAAFALGGWIVSLRVKRFLLQEEQRQNEKVSIRISIEAKKYLLPIRIRRSDLSRAEVLGLLGMIPMKSPGARYQIEYLNNQKFFEDLEIIRNASGDSILDIEVTPTEADAFNFNHLPAI